MLLLSLFQLQQIQQNQKFHNVNFINKIYFITRADTTPAVVAEQFKAYDQIQGDCHSKTQVWIPLEACML